MCLIDTTVPDNSSPVKVYKILIKEAKEKYVGVDKPYPHLANFANDAFRKMLEDLNSKKI